mmetsp:Transcript_4480/g.6578  ORF Transcript_4480/g.6578 Transcript_4480/m.6578 type:complete len:126 (+) Transcript_4480:48-425(+)
MPSQFFSPSHNFQYMYQSNMSTFLKKSRCHSSCNRYNGSMNESYDNYINVRIWKGPITYGYPCANLIEKFSTIYQMQQELLAKIKDAEEQVQEKLLGLLEHYRLTAAHVDILKSKLEIEDNHPPS